MKEVKDNSIALIITSPPYPMIEMWDKMFEKVGAKTYEEMHNYLAKIWKECYRVLIDGGICCINIGDATRRTNGSFKLYPNHSKVIEICENIGFKALPFILWKKATTKPNAFLGSGFLPPNAYVTQDCEFILIFRKGELRKFEDSSIRYKSKYTKEERDKWFSQIWEVNGVKQNRDKLLRRTAEYPSEIVYRLIRMFSVIGDTILDPFLGTGTTIRVAKALKRNSIGYEIDKNLLPIIKGRLDINQKKLEEQEAEVEIVIRD
ncbi:MAG: site-specific DNA-methyltransferase [Candidatus Pacearchaeota archaeon]